MEIRRSEKLGELAAALAKAQLNFKPITKDTSNPFFHSKYADQATLIAATRPALAAEGLVVIQTISDVEGKSSVEVTTMLLHSSDQFIAHDLELPVAKFDAQGIGSASTYGKRYSYQAILCIAGEEDDDGNAASGKTIERSAPKPAPRPTPAVKPASELFPPESGVINPAMAKKFWDIVKNSGKRSQQEVLDYFGGIGIEGTAEMPKKDFESACEWARGDQ